MSDKLPPYSEEAEKAVIACMLNVPTESIPAVNGILKADDFFVPAHRVLFLEINYLSDRGTPIDVTTVHQRLVDAKLAEQIGGPGILAELSNSFATAATVTAHCATIKRDALRRKTIADAHETIREALEEPEKFSSVGFEKRLPESEDASELTWELLPPDPPFVVEGVLHRGSKMVLGGSSKAGKTWSLVDLAVSVASGKPWWGFPTSKGKVLYVNFEIQSPFFRRRVAKIKQVRGIEIDPNFLRLLTLRGRKFSQDQFAAALVNDFREYQPSLVILDPMYKLLIGQDENATSALSRLGEQFDQIVTELNTALVFGAHFSKGNQAAKDSIDRISGSGIVARDGDAIMTLTKHTEQDCYTLEAILRNCPPIDPRVLRWNFPLMETDHHLDPTDLKKVGGRPETCSKEELLDLVLKPTTYSEWLQAAESIGFSKTTFNRKRRELIERGLVTQAPGANLWVKKVVA